MELRYYQREACKAVANYLKSKQGNPCIEVPTGGGKTPIIASLCRYFAEAGARVLCVAHRKELLEQTAEKMKTWAPNVQFSIVSAGLNSQDYTGDVVIAGVQSVYRNTSKLIANGRIHYVIVDEAHLIPATEENADGMYQTLLRELRAFNPSLRVIGLTATPYRLNSGSVCGDDKILTEICYRVKVPELISNHYLSPLISKAPPVPVENTDFHIEHGEFKASEVDAAYNDEKVISEAVHKIIALTKNRKKVLLFCCSKDHCWAVANALKRKVSEGVEVVLGDTKASARDDIVRRFRGSLQSDLFGNTEQELKFLCNVEVLTTGFDAPNVDTVVLLRPTASPGLYYQMCGRGFRICEGKQDCLIIDFAGNIERFGAIDTLEPPKPKVKGEKQEKKNKACPLCFESVPLNARVCPSCGSKLKCDDIECPRCHSAQDMTSNFCSECGFQFRQLAKHGEDYDETHDILSGGKKIVIEEEILKVQYFEHESKRTGKRMLRVDYTTPTLELCEYICLEHDGYAQQKAFKWWCERSDIRPIPYTARQAFELADSGCLTEPRTIKYTPKKPGAFQPDILGFDMDGPKPEPSIYPRTDNPLHLHCVCGNDQSFIYEGINDIKQVVCPFCGGVVYEISPDSFPNETEREGIESQFESASIAFYSHVARGVQVVQGQKVSADIPF